MNRNRAVERVFLIGARGSGKTTAGRFVAERLGWQMIDADEEIERRAGRSIREIFDQEGESGFRQRETEVLRKIASIPNCVIATGGGAVIRPENRDLMRRSGLVVWLTADPEILWQRMQSDPRSSHQRPALTALDGLNEMRTIVAQRREWYAQCADLTIDTSGRSPQDVAQMILDFLARTADELR